MLLQDFTRRQTEYEGYRIFSTGHCAIVYKENLKAKRLVFDSGRILGLELKNAREKITLITAYIKHSDAEGILELRAALDTLSPSSLHSVVIATDCNGRSPLWDPRGNGKNFNGRRVEELISDYELRVENTQNSQPTFHDSMGRPAWIDVTLSSRERIRDWRVLSLAAGISDHECISFVIPGFLSQDTPKKVHNWKRADWDKIQHMLWRDFNRRIDKEFWLKSGDNLEKDAELFTQIIQEAIDAHVPKVRLRPEFSHWWTDELTTKLRRVKVLSRAIQRRQKSGRTEVPGHWFVDLGEARRDFRRSVVRAKNAGWRFKVENTDEHGLWKLYNSLDGPKEQLDLSFVVDANGQRLDKEADVRRCLVAKFFPTLDDVLSEYHQQKQHSVDKELLEINNKWESTQLNWDAWRDSYFSIQEVWQAIADSNINSSPGLDGIPLRFFKKTFDITGPYLTAILGASIRFHSLPQAWRTASIHPIPKGRYLHHLKNIRPISLLNTITKLLERLVGSRIMEECELNGSLHSGQFGFRAGRSIQQALHGVIQTVKDTWKQKLFTMGLALDLKGAFDHIWVHYLLACMIDLKLPDPLILWVRSFGTGRRAMLMGQELVIGNSIPQGSPISPVLFLLVMDSCLKRAFPENSTLRAPPVPCAFADDLFVTFTIPTNENTDQAQSVLHSLAIWAWEARMIFEPSKTQVIFFAKRKKSIEVDLYLKGEQIPQPVDVIRLLGLWLDRKLLFKHHVEKVAAKAWRGLHRLKKLANSSWGANGVVLNRLLQMGVFSGMFFAADVWGGLISATNLDTVVGKVLRAGLQWLLGVPGTSAIFFLHVLSGCPPGHLLVEKACWRQGISLWTQAFRGNWFQDGGLQGSVEEEADPSWRAVESVPGQFHGWRSFPGLFTGKGMSIHAVALALHQIKEEASGRFDFQMPECIHVFIHGGNIRITGNRKIDLELVSLFQVLEELPDLTLMIWYEEVLDQMLLQQGKSGIEPRLRSNTWTFSTPWERRGDFDDTVGTEACTTPTAIGLSTVWDVWDSVVWYIGCVSDWGDLDGFREPPVIAVICLRVDMVRLY
ncbi:hypothetical protein BSKO_07415 [Bryopsis sp. KO-2023]|nr:hypothetical protein BSKO_07415 [Bryopsis sp. KO-2023]